MIQKITFTPQVQFGSADVPEIHVEEPIRDGSKVDKSGLLYGTLASLGAFGVGLVARKPQAVEKVITNTVKEPVEKVVEKIITKTVEKPLTPFERQAIWQAKAKSNPNIIEVQKTSQNASKDVGRFVENSIPQSSVSYYKGTAVNQEVRPELEQLKNDMLTRAREAEYKANKPGKVKKGKGNSAKKYQKQEIERQIELSTVTPQQQAAYDKAIAYKRPTPKQKEKIAQMHAKNEVQRAQANSIENQISIQDKNRLQAAVNTAPMSANALNHKLFVHENGNQYIVDKGKIVKIIDNNTIKGKSLVIEDERKIAKHLASRNITIANLMENQAKSLQGAA